VWERVDIDFVTMTSDEVWIMIWIYMQDVDCRYG
jgi:hypothetical protein